MITSVTARDALRYTTTQQAVPAATILACLANGTPQGRIMPRSGSRDGQMEAIAIATVDCLSAKWFREHSPQQPKPRN